MSIETHEIQNWQGPRQYRNSEKLLASSDPYWQAAADHGLIDIHVEAESNNRLFVRESGHEFINMCSCSYLGLNYHPKVVQGAIDALEEARSLGLSLANTRIRHDLLFRLEEELGELFGAFILPGVTCSVLTAGILPLLASGHLAPGGPRVMVFDRMCHFSMAYVKPICADETLVLTSPHNDLDYLEDVCRRYPNVAYVADGAYSMGGAAALDGLRELQERYGLFLYLDDSHGLSIFGEHGEGYVRSHLGVNPLTIIVATLSKGFGCGSGAVAMLGDRRAQSLLMRHAGPVGWSSNMEIPIVGAALASAALHRSPELGELQRRHQGNIDYFDELFPTAHAGNGLPVRRIDVGDADRAVKLSAELYRRGYYSSAVFFPIVPRGEAGLRIMLRADLGREQIAAFVEDVKDVTGADH
ncbi:8-amino-7-oxononanoate synthase family protein [Streptomyces griseocarneus]|uniref:8-amino-7-oxononanoate synthase family protein n=1 Tax=Streptomyces griseocarneus TaxID=51201 RepID=UPI0019CA5FEF|nr:aminotransferase class I/II-fold pyridoxal phosphate-dependent enzyme [Streptomyces griseocarneus]MBZ6475002.1 aminotransferase class I/II-fold pyridoxal phosphate-dependent enzyme [Streptomyces griseocarneus]GHG62842.1 7-keto-8-aminopelargonate synthetase [Streptomyces griseocarneus]